MKKVEVVWIDITSHNGWHTQNQIDRLIANNQEGMVYQIGYLYEEDDDQVVLLDSYFVDKNTLGGIHKIPRGCIKSITYLTSAKHSLPAEELVKQDDNLKSI